MFHDGQYLEVIKASDNCLATVIITVKEKIVRIDKKKISTNKWLSLDDWYELYKIIQKAILRNSKVNKERDKLAVMERKKSTKRLDIVYIIEPPEDIKNKNTLPTVKVRVSPAKRSSRIISQSSVINTNNNKKNNKAINKASINLFNSPEAKVQRLMEGVDSYTPEEYVPTDLLNKEKAQENLNYIPSRKSLLIKMKQTNESNSNEYSPTLANKQSFSLKDEVGYVPNPISSLKKVNHEIYDPCEVNSLPPELNEAYVPSSKGSYPIIEEYQPDFSTKTMKFDNSYIPSSKRPVDQAKNRESVRKKSRSENQTKIRKKLFLNDNKKLSNSSNPKKKL